MKNAAANLAAMGTVVGACLGAVPFSSALAAGTIGASSAQSAAALPSLPSGTFPVEKGAVTPSAARIRKEWERFAKEPHPMGSAAQTAYAKHIHDSLGKAGFAARYHLFEAPAPNRKAQALGEKEAMAPKIITEKGRNVVGVRKGPLDCAVLLGGHYDTKEFLKERFVGANDGGSSTVLLLEIARTIGKARPGKGTYGGCDLHLAFFDGEEAYLKDWNDGQRVAGVRDNLYGSNAFVKDKLAPLPGDRHSALGGKHLQLLVLFDMVGHKKQKIFLTMGSDPEATKALLDVKGEVDMSEARLGIEDDHTPFAQRGVPFVHAIDWTNLEEWHTPKDDLSIVSPEKVASLALAVQRFLARDRTKP